MENNIIQEETKEPKIKKTNSQLSREWQLRHPEKMKQYRELENIKRREKRRLLRILL